MNNIATIRRLAYNRQYEIVGIQGLEYFHFYIVDTNNNNRIINNFRFSNQSYSKLEGYQHCFEWIKTNLCPAN